MSRNWGEVARDSEAESSAGQGDLVGEMLESFADARLFATASGSRAVLLRGDAVDASAELSLEQEEGASPLRLVAVIVDAADGEDFADLLQHCDALALPESLDTAAPAGTTAAADAPAGRLVYRRDEGPPATFSLFRRQAADAGLLTRGAPLAIGEPEGNLDAREKWFRKRHGS